MSKALKKTRLLPYKFPFQIFSIQKTNDIRTNLICPECHEQLKRQFVCPEHGHITKPIKRTPEGVIISDEDLKKIKGSMKDFQVIGRVHLASIPLYQLGKAYYIKTEFLGFIALLLELRKTNNALIVKGTIRQGIKHFVIYAKGSYAILQELVESDVLQIEPTIPKEKIRTEIQLPEPKLIREIKADNIKERYTKIIGGVNV